MPESATQKCQKVLETARKCHLSKLHPPLSPSLLRSINARLLLLLLQNLHPVADTSYICNWGYLIYGNRGLGDSRSWLQLEKLCFHQMNFKFKRQEESFWLKSKNFVARVSVSESICSILFSPGSLPPPYLIERLFKNLKTLLRIIQLCCWSLNNTYWIGNKQQRPLAYFVWFDWAFPIASPVACWKSWGNAETILVQAFQ